MLISSMVVIVGLGALLFQTSLAALNSPPSFVCSPNPNYFKQIAQRASCQAFLCHGVEKPRSVLVLCCCCSVKGKSRDTAQDWLALLQISAPLKKAFPFPHSWCHCTGNIWCAVLLNSSSSVTEMLTIRFWGLLTMGTIVVEI